jgi:hypothetical protein
MIHIASDGVQTRHRRCFKQHGSGSMTQWFTPSHVQGVRDDVTRIMDVIRWPLSLHPSALQANRRMENNVCIIKMIMYSIDYSILVWTAKLTDKPCSVNNVYELKNKSCNLTLWKIYIIDYSILVWTAKLTDKPCSVNNVYDLKAKVVIWLYERSTLSITAYWFERLSSQINSVQWTISMNWKTQIWLCERTTRRRQSFRDNVKIWGSKPNENKDHVMFLNMFLLLM